ncbi:MAG: hypothetical protein ABFS02_11260 [Pseudomonadota bacterium]
MIFQHLEQRRRIDAIRIRECNEHQHQKQEIRQDIQMYEGMLSVLREQRLKKSTDESAGLAMLRRSRKTATEAGLSIDETRLSKELALMAGLARRKDRLLS